MDLRHLRYFLALAESLDLQRAAKQCGLSPSLFSRKLSELEEVLGITLFRKRSGKVTLSAGGQVFLERAKEILASANEAIGEAKASVAAAKRKIRLGHYGVWWSMRYEKALKRFQMQNPDVQVEAIEFAPVELPERLLEGDVDVAFLEHVDVGLRIDFNIKRLEQIPSLVIMGAGHALAKRRRVSLDELGLDSWVAWDERVFPGRRQRFLDAAQGASFVPCIALDADCEKTVFENVLNLGALAYVPDLPTPLPSGLVSVALRPSSIQFPVFLAWPHDSDNQEQLNSLAACLLK